MKTRHAVAIAVLGLALFCLPATAQLVIPSDGSDGVFAPTEDVVVDLAEAVNGAWNLNNNAHAGQGVYDANKWAIVFKYSSVNIPEGVTVSFTNHRSRAPVVWLVQGDVSIYGLLDLDGAPAVGGVGGLIPTEPGPGGFRGGPYGPQGAGAGLGPGGGQGAGDGTFGAYASSYGNPQILPLIGGSGGGAAAMGWGDSSRGGGGGAIMIAASGVVELEGTIRARGSAGGIGKTASGGAVRIIASQVLGGGSINCLPEGRTRIEAHTLSASLRTFPETIAVPPAVPPLIWPPETAPKVKILSVDSLPAPIDPTAPLVSSADIAIQNDAAAVVLLETRDFPIEGKVQLRVARKWGIFNWVDATYVSGNQAEAIWGAEITFVKGYTTLQARATAP